MTPPKRQSPTQGVIKIEAGHLLDVSSKLRQLNVDPRSEVTVEMIPWHSVRARVATPGGDSVGSITGPPGDVRLEPKVPSKS